VTKRDKKTLAVPPKIGRDLLGPFRKTGRGKNGQAVWRRVFTSLCSSLLGYLLVVWEDLPSSAWVQVEKKRGGGRTKD